MSVTRWLPSHGVSAASVGAVSSTLGLSGSKDVSRVSFSPAPSSDYLQFRDEAPGRRARYWAVGLAGCHGC